MLPSSNKIWNSLIVNALRVAEFHMHVDFVSSSKEVVVCGVSRKPLGGRCNDREGVVISDTKIDLPTP